MSNIARSPPPRSCALPHLLLPCSLVQLLRSVLRAAHHYRPCNLLRVSPGDGENFTQSDRSNVGIGIYANPVTGRSSPPRARTTVSGEHERCRRRGARNTLLT